MPWTKARKRQSRWSAVAPNRSYQGWNPRWMYLLSSWLAPKLARKKSSLCTLKCTNSGDYRGLLPESWSYWRKWCLPLKTAKGRNKRRHQKWQQGPSQQTSDPQVAEPLGGRREASVERSLANMREAHQKALAMVVVLEEEIEWLSCPLIRSWPEVWVHPKRTDHHVHGSRGQKRRHHQV